MITLILRRHANLFWYWTFSCLNKFAPLLHVKVLQCSSADNTVYLKAVLWRQATMLTLRPVLSVRCRSQQWSSCFLWPAMCLLSWGRHLFWKESSLLTAALHFIASLDTLVWALTLLPYINVIAKLGLIGSAFYIHCAVYIGSEHML